VVGGFIATGRAVDEILVGEFHFAAEYQQRIASTRGSMTF